MARSTSCSTPPKGAKALADCFSIRRSALLYHIPYYTTLAGALAVTEAIKALRAGGLKVAPIQDYVGQTRGKFSAKSLGIQHFNQFLT